MKNYKVFIILLVIAILVNIGIIIILPQINNKMIKESEKKSEAQAPDYTDVMPKRINDLTSVYYGSMDAEDIIHSLSDFMVYNLPEISTEIYGKSESELNDFYDKNSNDIYKKLGIDNKKDFLTFAKDLQSKIKSADKLVYSSSYILEGSIYNNSGIDMKATLAVKYKNMDNILYFAIEIQNTSSIIKYNIVEPSIDTDLLK